MGFTDQTKKHDIAHIASSIILASSGAGFFFACDFFLPFCLSNNLNRGDSFLRYLPPQNRSRLYENVEED